MSYVKAIEIEYRARTVILHLIFYRLLFDHLIGRFDILWLFINDLYMNVLHISIGQCYIGKIT